MTEATTTAATRKAIAAAHAERAAMTRKIWNLMPHQLHGPKHPEDRHESAKSGNAKDPKIDKPANRYGWHHRGATDPPKTARPEGRVGCASERQGP